MSLTGQIALVLGATGNVGSAAVMSFLRKGATVIAPSRSLESLAKLKQTLKDASISTENLVPMTAELSTIKGIQEFTTAVSEKMGKCDVDHVVSSSGSWFNNPPMHQMEMDVFPRMLSSLESHFYTYRTFAPMLLNKPHGSYTIVTGMAGFKDSASHKVTPGGMYGGLVAVIAGMQRGFGAQAVGETLDQPARINELRIGIRIESDADYKKMGKKEEWLTCSSEFSGVFDAVIGAKGPKHEIVLVTNRTEMAKLIQEHS